jgi:hypothetical protein
MENLMRSALGLVVSGLSGIAAIIASLDGDGDIVPFFVGLTFAGGLAAWAAHPPFEGSRRQIARGVALVWLLAGVWVGVLLVMSMTVWQASSPPPTPEETYLGLRASVYHLVGLYAGAVLVPVLAFGRPGWFGDPVSAAKAEPSRL